MICCPFANCFPRLGLVKVSNAAYKAYDLDLPTPASVSQNVLDGLLRVKLGYGGVIVADHSKDVKEVGMIPNIGSAFSAGALGLNFDTFAGPIIAGCDMLVAGSGGRLIEPTAESLRKSLDLGILPAQRASEARKRVGKAKKGMRLPTGKFSKKAFDQLCREFEDFSRECRDAEREIV